MNWNAALNYIESHRFAAKVNIASSLRIFLTIIREDEYVRFVRAQLINEGKAAELTTRAYQKTQESVDPRYENKWDVALTVYLWILLAEKPKFASPVAYAVLNTPQCWWADQLARNTVLGSIESRTITEADFTSEVGTYLAPGISRGISSPSVAVEYATAQAAGEELLIPPERAYGVRSLHYLEYDETEQNEAINFSDNQVLSVKLIENKRTKNSESELVPIGVD